jgi:hypothetical protein
VRAQHRRLRRRERATATSRTVSQGSIEAETARREQALDRRPLHRRRERPAAARARDARSVGRADEPHPELEGPDQHVAELRARQREEEYDDGGFVGTHAEREERRVRVRRRQRQPAERHRQEQEERPEVERRRRLREPARADAQGEKVRRARDHGAGREHEGVEDEPCDHSVEREPTHRHATDDHAVDIFSVGDEVHPAEDEGQRDCAARQRAEREQQVGRPARA